MSRKNNPHNGRTRPFRYSSLMLAAGLVAPLAAGAQTNTENEDEDSVALDQISVTAQRGAEGIDVSDVPGSVSIIERDMIERHATTSSELDTLLAKEVPGFSASNEAQTDFGETLRGRNFLVMIDGVPITSPSYAGARALQNIAPSGIERIEVVRGAVATYGSGATGGIINIITRDVSDETRRWTKIKGSASTTHPDGSGTAGVEQGLSGSIGDTRYSVTASIEEQAGQFDAEGDRIPPNRYSNQGGDEGERRTVNLQTRLDHSLDSERSLDLAFNYYDSEQDSDYIADFLTGTPPTSEKAAAVPRSGMRDNEINPASENLNLSLGYRDRQFLEQDFRAKVFYKDRKSVYGWTDWPAYYSAATEGGNSYLTSETFGARGEFDGKVGNTAVTWGMDASQDETAQLITNGQQSMPPTTTTSVAPFVQLERNIGESWTLSGGVRHEIAEVSVDDYTTVQISPRTVEGGTLDYSETVFNLGAVYDFNPTWSGFAAFSQGFALGNIGRLLGQTSASSVEASDPEAQVVDNYEIGLRATGMTWDGSITLFESRSDLGTSYTTSGGAIELQRQKERIYGVEADINVDIGRAWRTGGSLAIVEGRYDSDSDGDIDEYLGADRISPPKLDSYVEREGAGWTHRLSAHYVGDRDRFEDNTAYLQGDVDSYTTFDLSSSTRIGDGVLELAVTNLFNEQYIPALGQAYNFGGVGYVAAPGRRVAASYKIDW